MHLPATCPPQQGKDIRREHPTVLTRRSFLGGVFGAGAATGLSGCCHMSPLPPPDLSPETLVIDAHCHIFNGWDLDIYNYQVPHIPNMLGILPAVLYSIAAVVRAIAPTGKQELNELRSLLGARASATQPLSPENRAWARDQFAREVRRRTAQLAEETRGKRDALLNASDPKAVLRSLMRDQRMTMSAQQQAQADANLTTAVRKLRTPAVLAFFEGLFHYRLVNAQRLINLYRTVGLFTPAMMDTDSWFQRRVLRLPTCTPLTEQIEIYEHVAVATNGRVLPFFAFDPRRDSSLRLVEECLSRKCFVGIKLYPPMGYRPFRNAERDQQPPNCDWEPGLGARLDGRLAQVFRRCKEEEFCVMAHNNKSQESAPPYADNGNPRYWEELLSQPGLKKLKVNLGHFGGMGNKSGWRDEICALMKNYPEVYADVGDFVEIGCDKKREAFFAALQKLQGATKDSPLLGRLMYGSDFFMNGIAPGYQAYADNWIVSFQQHFKDNWRGFVGGNAAAFLGLSSDQQGARLRRFMKDNDLAPPWMGLA